MLLAVALVASGSALAFRIGDLITGTSYSEALVTAQRPMVVNPLFKRGDPAVTDVGSLLYRGLMRLDNAAKPVPDLAQSVKLSADGLSYVLTLSNSKWSDGRQITAADVVNTVAVVQERGYSDSNLVAAWQGATLSAAANTVTVHLSQPRASFEASLTQLPILPLANMSATQLQNLQNRDTSPLPTSGLYRVAKTDASSITLAPNGYSSTHPSLNTVTFQLFGSFGDALASFKSGHSDGLVARTPAQRDQLLSAHHGSISDLATFQFDDLLFNQRYPGLSDIAVRTAISNSLDRSAIIAQGLSGQGVSQTGAIPQGITWALPHPAGNNSAGAQSATAIKASLDAAGWLVGADGWRVRDGVVLRLPISVDDDPALMHEAQVISSQLAQVNIDAPVSAVHFNDLVTTVLNKEAFALAVVDWANGPDPDISAYWRSNANPPRGFNFSAGPPDLFLDQALDSLATVSDLAGRRQAAATVAADLGVDLPAVFLDSRTVTFASNSGVRNLGLPPTGGSAARFYSIATWSRG